MRTTVTIDPDVEALLRRAIRQRGDSFKKVLNAALRDGLSKPAATSPKPFRMKSFNMGKAPGVNLTKALALAAELEDAEIIRKLRTGR